MNQESSNYSGGQNWPFPANQNSSEFPVPDAAEVSGQAKTLVQLDLSSSRERTQSTNDKTKSASMETLKLYIPQLSEDFLNNRSEVQENAVEGNENHNPILLYKKCLDDEDAKNLPEFFHENTPEFNKPFCSGDSFGDEDLANIVTQFEIDYAFFHYPNSPNYICDDSLSAVPNHATNRTAQNMESNSDIENASPIYDNPVTQSRPQKDSELFGKSNKSRGRKERGPKSSLIPSSNVKSVQLKSPRSQKKINLEKNSEQNLRTFRFQNLKSENDSNANEELGESSDPEFNEVINTFKRENPNFANNDTNNHDLQRELMRVLGYPPAPLVQPVTSEPNAASQLKKSKENPAKKLKAINAPESSQTFPPMKSSPLGSSTQMASENESEDEHSEPQNERERRRNPRNIQNKTLNVCNKSVPDFPPQPQTRQAEALQSQMEDPEISGLAFKKTTIRTSFLKPVRNRMFDLLEDKELGKRFRDTIRQEAWFKYLVKRVNWFESLLQLENQSSEEILQKEGLYDEAIKIVIKCYQKASQLEEPDQEALQRYQIAFPIVRSYEKALQAAKQCEIEMGRKWFKEALRWKDFQDVICSKKWAQVNKKTLPQDQCDKCSQSEKCDECREFESLCIFLHAIYKKGINEKGEERGEIKSLERLSEFVGNERFSEPSHVIEMDLKEFCQKAGSSVMAIFLKEEEEFYEISTRAFYIPKRNTKKQPDGEKVLRKEEKMRLLLVYKSEIRKRFATPKDYPKVSKKR